MVAGVELVNFYTSEAIRIQAGAQIGVELQLAQRLLEWLQTGWPEPLVSLPEIYRLGPAAIRDKKTAARLVSILVDHGYLLPGGEGEVAGTTRRETWTIRRSS